MRGKTWFQAKGPQLIHCYIPACSICLQDPGTRLCYVLMTLTEPVIFSGRLQPFGGPLKVPFDAISEILKFLSGWRIWLANFIRTPDMAYFFAIEISQ
jgi:hypothetical protein